MNRSTGKHIAALVLGDSGMTGNPFEAQAWKRGHQRSCLLDREGEGQWFLDTETGEAVNLGNVISAQVIPDVARLKVQNGAPRST